MSVCPEIFFLFWLVLTVFFIFMFFLVVLILLSFDISCTNKTPACCWDFLSLLLMFYFFILKKMFRTKTTIITRFVYSMY